MFAKFKDSAGCIVLTRTHVVLLALDQALVFLLLSRGQHAVLFVSRQVGTNLHPNGFLERVLLVLTAIVMQS